MSVERAEFDALLGQCRRRLAEIDRRIHTACERAGRRREDVEILGVTKGHPANYLELARDLGIRRVGENRVQDLLDKIDGLPKELEVQFIGRLQTNKVNKLVGRVGSIASVDRPELLDRIARRAAEIGVRQAIWIQVNISGEAQKGGCPPEQAAQLWRRAADRRLHPLGLMGMGRHDADESGLRQSFATLRGLGDAIRAELPDRARVGLSMGMSGDFEIAVEEGATQVRLGTALFGPRV